MEDNQKMRFGTIAVKRGYITPIEFATALMVQVSSEMEKKQHKLIGEILLELGYMNASQVNEVLDLILQQQIDKKRMAG